jgi:hypothetical protein
MTRGNAACLWAAWWLIVGCGGSCPQANDAASTKTDDSSAQASNKESEPAAESSSTDSSGPSGASAEPGDSSASAPPKDESASAEKPAAAEPAFPEDASVAQAIAAVPKGTQRANIEPDVLGEPLQNVSLYAPCNVGSQHFKVKVAVWGGHAVGVDVSTPNTKLAACVKKQVRTVEWHDKVQSLNTVEFSM